MVKTLELDTHLRQGRRGDFPRGREASPRDSGLSCRISSFSHARLRIPVDDKSICDSGKTAEIARIRDGMSVSPETSRTVNFDEPVGTISHH